MDKIKVKYITLDEMKNIDPSLIKSMTFTDGSVVMVNPDKEDEPKNFQNKELNQDIFNPDEKEPDIQDNPNIYLNYESDENISTNNNLNKYQKSNNNQQRNYYTQSQNININRQNMISLNKNKNINNNLNIRRNNIDKPGSSFENEKNKKK